MSKYVYPAIFKPNESGGFCVEFPDLISAYTEGDNLADSMDAAQDVLCLVLYNNEEKNIKFNAPSDLKNVQAPECGFVTLISCDTNTYKKYFANKVVNKTVTIPAKLNYDAEQAGINFSQVLREGLEHRLYQT